MKPPGRACGADGPSEVSLCRSSAALAVKQRVRRAVRARFCVRQLRLRRIDMKDLENCSCASIIVIIILIFYDIVAARNADGSFGCLPGEREAARVLV